jgi:uncharacterized protein YacL
MVSYFHHLTLFLFMLHVLNEFFYTILSMLIFFHMRHLKHTKRDHIINFLDKKYDEETKTIKF